MRLRKNPAGNDFSIGKKLEWDLQMPTDITTCENGCRIFSLHGKDFFTCQIVVEYQKDVVNRRRLNLNADEFSSIAENVIRLFCMHSAANVCLHHCQWLAKRVNNGAHNKVKSCVAVTGKMLERPSNDASSEHCESMFLWLLVILHARTPSAPALAAFVTLRSVVPLNTSEISPPRTRQTAPLVRMHRLHVSIPCCVKAS